MFLPRAIDINCVKIIPKRAYARCCIKLGVLNKSYSTITQPIWKRFHFSFIVPLKKLPLWKLSLGKSPLRKYFGKWEYVTHLSCFIIYLCYCIFIYLSKGPCDKSMVRTYGRSNQWKYWYISRKKYKETKLKKSE